MQEAPLYPPNITHTATPTTTTAATPAAMSPARVFGIAAMGQPRREPTDAMNARTTPTTSTTIATAIDPAPPRSHSTT